MPVTGQQAIAKNIITYGGGFLNSVNKVMEDSRKILDDQITINLKASYFSLKDLSRLDHPYASRHGSRGKNIPNPYWKVHERSGKLLSSKKSGVVNASIINGNLKSEAYVGLDRNIAPHALAVVFGTSKMIPRPVLMQSRQQVSGQIYTLISNRLKNLKVSFS